MTYLKIAFVSILLKIQNNILLLLQKIIWRSPPSKINNIIIYKNGNIGDIIAAYPAIKKIRLKYPNAQIVLLSSPGSKHLTSAVPLLESQRLVNEVIYYYDSKIFHLLNQIRQRKFDLAFIMPESRTNFLRQLRNLFFFTLLNIKHVYGFFVTRLNFFENSFAQKIPYPFKNEVERNFKILNMEISEKNNLFEFSNNNISNKIFDITKKFNNTLIIATGAKLKSKQWNKDHFFEIAKLWIRNKGDIVFIGNKKDGGDAETMIARLKEWRMKTELIFKSHNWYNLCNQTTLNETIFLIQNSSAMIANDSGPAHLSSFTNTKVITIQASQDFKLMWDPFFSRELVFRPNRAHICRCSIDSCENCINDITHDDVWEKLKSLT